MRDDGKKIVRLTTVPRQDHGLTVQDRIHALSWEADAAAQQGIRLAIHPREGDAPEHSDFVSIYPRNQPFASFSVARNGGRISVWRSGNGRDVGRYNTMREALAAVTVASLERRR